MACLTRTQRIERWLEAARTGKVRPEDAKAAVKYLREKIIREAQERNEALPVMDKSFRVLEAEHR